MKVTPRVMLLAALPHRLYAQNDEMIVFCFSNALTIRIGQSHGLECNLEIIA